MTLDSIKPYAKTIVAILGAVVTAAVQAFPDSPEVARWATVASTILTAVAVYAVPNKDPRATHQDESVQPPLEGEGHMGSDLIARHFADKPGDGTPDRPNPYWDGI